MEDISLSYQERNGKGLSIASAKTQSMKVWESNQEVEHLLDFHKAVGSIPSTRKKN